MRRNAISAAAREEDSEINLTPMLDVVFIMLIFLLLLQTLLKNQDLKLIVPIQILQKFKKMQPF